MVQSASVKYFLHSDTGAPVLTGAPGTIEAILHACLVTGYNASAVDSITRDGTTVTVTVSAGHGLAAGVVAEIANADQTEYNGEHRITTATASEFEFELAAGVEPATPATGTIDCRQAPAGWERSFVSGDTLRAAFRSPAVDATGMYIYIDDTNNQGTRRTGVKGYESMTDIDTGVNPFPYSAADDQWVWWHKSTNETTTRQWAIVADDKLFWIYINNGDNYGSGHRLFVAGDLVSHLPIDNWACVVGGAYIPSTDIYHCPVASVGVLDTNVYASGLYLARDYLGAAKGTSIISAVAPFLVLNTSSDLDDQFPRALGSAGLNFPSPVHGGAVLSPVSYIEQHNNDAYFLRGSAPGMMAPLHNRPYATMELVDSSAGLAGNRFMAVEFMNARNNVGNSPSTIGQVLLDIIGPWR